MHLMNTSALVCQHRASVGFSGPHHAVNRDAVGIAHGGYLPAQPW